MERIDKNQLDLVEVGIEYDIKQCDNVILKQSLLTNVDQEIIDNIVKRFNNHYIKQFGDTKEYEVYVIELTPLDMYQMGSMQLEIDNDKWWTDDYELIEYYASENTGYASKLLANGNALFFTSEWYDKNNG